MKLNEEKKKDSLKRKLLKENIEIYQSVSEHDSNITSDEEESLEHVNPALDELQTSDDTSIQLENIKRKCKYKDEYAKDNVILSVNHLKQYFYFGSGVSKYKLKAVHDVNFQVKEGECFGLVGESGCGKTTTGRSIIRLYNITSGSIYYKGHRIGAGSRWNEKEIKFTKIRYNKRVKELDTQLKEGKITKEEHDKLLAEAKQYKDNVVSVQKAKINQIRKDDKNADKLGVNDDKIKIIKLQIKALERQLKGFDPRLDNLAEEEKNSKEHLKNYTFDLKQKLNNGVISKEAFDKSLEEAKKVHESRVIAIQEKVNQVKKENENQGGFKPNEAEINSLIAKLKSEISELKATNHRLMSEIQMIFQDPVDSLDPRMTVETIISEGLQIQGFKNKAENHKRVVEALERVGLIEDYANRFPHEFSGGQRQRIGIARALVMNPKFLICDEPISALDVSIRAQIINLLNELKEEMNLSILFIAHDLSVVKYFCDRIAVMYFGEIVELATSDELFKHPLHPYTKSLLSAIPKPNPITEKKRKRIVYNPQTEHDYSVEKPKFVEVVPGHFILANSAEVEKYKEEIAILDEKRLHEEELEKANENKILAEEKQVIQNEEVLETKEETNEVETHVSEETVSKETKTIKIKEEVKETLVDDETKEIKEINSTPETLEETDEGEVEDKKVLDDCEEVEKEALAKTNKKYKKVYHLKKVDGRWQIILKEGKKVIKTFATKEEGLRYGKALAKSQDGTLLVHASKGKNKGKFQKI